MEAMPLVGSVPDAVTVADAAADQLGDPPETVGAGGTVRSRLAIDAAVSGVQADVLPALSTLRSSTSVEPSASTTTDPPDIGADQELPPLVDVRCS
jgi:hypothetical protein